MRYRYAVRDSIVMGVQFVGCGRDVLEGEETINFHDDEHMLELGSL